MIDPLDILKSVLKTEILILNVESNSFRREDKVEEEVVSSARFIILEKGSLTYQVETVRTRIQAPAAIFVPPWVRRNWQVPARGSALIHWCEFAPAIFEPSLHHLFVALPRDWQLEATTLRRMREDWSGKRLARQSPEVAMRLQGELKACLARFFTTPGGFVHGTRTEPERRQEDSNPEVTNVRSWLEENFTDADAARDVANHIKHSSSTFRQMFRDSTGYTISGYIEALRMRYARYLLGETSDSVKEIANTVGFRDPLYFSRQYHTFWGHAPRLERSRKLRS